MDVLDEQEIALAELRAAAYREAGHKAVYEHLGGAGDAYVWPNHTHAPDERAWHGQFRFRLCPEARYAALAVYHSDAPPLPPNWRRLFGIAGLLAVANHAWRLG